MKLVKHSVIFAIFPVLVIFLLSVGPRIEGIIHPVVLPAEITRIEADRETWSFVWGRSERIRNCSFVRLEWRLGGERYYSVADVEFAEGTRVRGAGDFSFGPWHVQLSPIQLLERSYVIVYHRCHWLWVTETRFYDARR